VNPEELKERIPVSELILSASRSGGPGGQNVNKVSTKVELRFNVLKSSFISDREKEMIMDVLKRRVNTEGELIIVSQSERTQNMNRKKVIGKFYLLVSKALTELPERKLTVPTFSSKSERIEKKKKRGIVKKLRRDSGISEDEL
jgi:ribosome-associated protein